MKISREIALSQWSSVKKQDIRHNPNCIINKYSDYVELVVYDKEFYCNRQKENVIEIDRTKLFKVNESGILAPNKEGATIQKLADSLAKSSNRALDMVKGYIQCNKWDYFITLTFSPKEVDRTCKKDVNYLWQKYKQKLQYEYPDIKIFLIPELHEKGGIHFHGFIGSANIDKYLVPAKNNKKTSKYYGEYLYSTSGSQIFNITNFKYGFNTCCKIDTESSKLQLAHYISKYITKQFKSGVGYNQKRYYHTRNLDYKDKKIVYLSQEEIDTILNSVEYTTYKDKNGLKVYHIKNGEIKNN